MIERPASTTTVALPASHELALSPPAAGLEATSDAAAITTWLVARAERNAHTFEAYRREANRLLQWMIAEGLTLASLKVEQVHDFFHLLENPPSHWIRPRKPCAGEILGPTQLLIGPLKSVEFTRRVLAQMMGYLQESGYVQRNVFKLSRRPVVVSMSVSARTLSKDDWHWLWNWIKEMPRRSQREKALAIRARWLFALLYHTGIRREEAAKGVMGDFVSRDKHWQLRVIGKRAKERFVTVNSALLEELERYRAEMLPGASRLPKPGEHYPLVLSVHQTHRSKTLTPRAIGAAVADVALVAAAACDDEHTRSRLQAMSTHWMRHTNASHRMQSGAALETTQDELGHNDPKTTRIYAHTENEMRRDDAEKLSRFVAPRATD